MPLNLALSPYHLATREAPAMLALTLGDHVVTLLPQPPAGTTKESVRDAARNSPRYFRLMESWRWSTPLWNAGVITSGLDHEDAAAELAGVYQSIAAEDSLAMLRPLTRGAEQRAAESPEKALDFLAGDLLRGGPDPGINIPVSAALDRFAVRHHLAVVRSGMPSIAQRAEQRMGERLFSIAIPILLRSGGGRIQLLRNDLHAELSALRDAVSQECADPALSRGAGQRTQIADSIHRAAECYAHAFNEWAPMGGTGDDENRERITAGYVSVTAMLVPADAILRSSQAAIQSLTARTPSPQVAPPPAERLIALVVREMNMQPERL